MNNRVPTVTPARTQLTVELGRSQNRSPFSQLRMRVNKRATANSSMATLEQSVFQQINQYRQQRGLAPLTRNATINQQARQHSQNMANSRTLSHNGFSARIQTIGKTIPYRAAAENVAYNAGFSNPAAQAVNGWLKSSGHLRNIMGNYNLTGIGVAKNSQGEFYFTQIFIRR
ncbi:CAP domain-containing protein [Leptolyngbya sp. NK1-12]|uniref:CAP domain-containing protein n=1 Tax=Leptolyngbya sp. NK1-12 TaxID=2547451 RepID=A0AA96WNG2_9CYAN|nr:CAP domain-containing protein [Leptolyngbya sp. NK1-12]WNZ24986.1 CAP domain-containing protein [Leptolyngbya sp. NK1-12]